MEQSFNTTLMRLETALESPVIPGELVSWSQDVVARAQEFAGPLAGRAGARHVETFADIEGESGEIQRRVELMRAEDARIGAAYAEFLDQARALAERAKELGPDEAAARADIERVGAAGLALVIAIRKQELAVKAWTVESVARDRGVKD